MTTVLAARSEVLNVFTTPVEAALASVAFLKIAFAALFVASAEMPWLTLVAPALIAFLTVFTSSAKFALVVISVTTFPETVTAVFVATTCVMLAARAGGRTAFLLLYSELFSATEPDLFHGNIRRGSL